MVIRPYKKDDFLKVLNFDNNPSNRRQAKLKSLDLDTYYCYVAEDAGNIYGFVFMEDLFDGNHYMVQINTNPKRCHLGTILVHNVFKHIGIGHINLCVNIDNLPAIAFYESLGFHRSGYTANYRKGQDKFWYNKEINND